MRRLHRLPALAVLLTVVVVADSESARADRVVLANGRVFDDVIAAEQGGAVSIDLGGGRLTVARSEVRAIEASPSTPAEFRSRAERLRATVYARGGETAAAREWIELARWARQRGYDFGAREAALEAAALDPALAELPALMSAVGYALDPGAGEWVPYDEAMRRRGFLQMEGAWLTPEAYSSRQQALAAASEASARAAEAARAERLADLAELQAEANLAAAQAPAYGGGFWLFPVASPFFGGRHFHHRGFPAPGFSPHPKMPSMHHFAPSVMGADLVGRQPGSILPIPRRSG